jgi:cytochrome c biogenesis protein CcdA
LNLTSDLVEKPPKLTTASRYTVLDVVVYLIAGATLIVWPGVVQTLFREEAFVGHEGALMRAIGMTIVLIGWLYVFGGRSGARQIVAASVIEPVAPELERIAALEDKKGFAEVVAYLHLLGTKPLFEADPVDECIRPPPFSCHRGHAPRLY